jgi:hypothetical protein
VAALLLLLLKWLHTRNSGCLSRSTRLSLVPLAAVLLLLLLPGSCCCSSTRLQPGSMLLQIWIWSTIRTRQVLLLLLLLLLRE